MSRVLIVSSWGYPGNWNPAVYTYKEVMEKSRTSLGAVAARYLKEGYSVRALVLAPDTLAASPVPRYCRDRLVEKWLCDPSKVRNYRELAVRVKGQIIEWIRACSESPSLHQLLEGVNGSGVTVKVVSSHGRYMGCGDYWSFARSPREGAFEPVSAYTGEAILAILESLLEVRPRRLIVDLTHGVNFMPMSLARASETSAMAYALATRHELELELVNSEPYPIPPPKEERDLPSLEVHIVYTSRYTARSVLEDASLRVIEAGDRLGKNPFDYLIGADLAGRIGKEASKHTKHLKAIGGYAIAAAQIALYNMPLAALYLSRELSNMKASQGSTFLEETVLALGKLKNLSIEYGNIDEDQHIVYPGLAFKGGRIEALALASGLLDYIAGIDPPTNIEQQGASLRELRKAAEELADLYKPIALNELDSLEKCTTSECAIPSSIGAWPNQSCTSKSISSLNPRNLRAHAGLERNIVEMMIADNHKNSRVRYRLYRSHNPLCWKKLLKYLKNAKHINN